MAPYAPGAAETSFMTWMYVNCSKTAGGSATSASCSLRGAAATAPGTYQIRRLFENGQYSLLTTRNTFTVQ